MSKDWYSMIQKSGHGLIASALPSVKANLLQLPSPSLNWALGGGLAYGKIITIYGPEQSGKSLLAQLAIAEMHANDKEAWAIWYDAEFSFDRDHARKLGVDVDRLWVVQSNKPSEIFDHFYDEVWPMIKNDKFPLKIMAIDSIKSIRGPRESVKDSVEDHVIGDISMLLNKAFRKIIEPVRKEGILTICVQQVNEEMDQTKQMQGIKWRVPSGQALKHFSDYMLLIEKVDRKDSKIFDNQHSNVNANMKIQLGHTVRCRVDKNRTDSPHLMAEFKLKYGVGVVDVASEITDLAINLGVITKPNLASYEFKGTKVVGRDNFVDLVSSRPELYRELVKAVNAIDIATFSGQLGGKKDGREIGMTDLDTANVRFDEGLDTTAPLKAPSNEATD